jgi:pimeloyl-ACP methyl ester carboxylesterase
VIQTLLTDRATENMVDELTSILSEFHPAAMRVAIPAIAEADLRDVLPHIDVPTLVLDARAPKHVWEPLHAGIRRSKLVVIPDVGHMIDMKPLTASMPRSAPFCERPKTESPCVSVRLG